MTMTNIKEHIYIELSSDEQKAALDFINYLENKNMTFVKDNGPCWKDKIYYWVTYNDKCVCFITIKDPDEPENHWTVWSDDMGSEWLKSYPIDENIKELAWEHIDHCSHCGSCGGGRKKTVFGRQFDDVCGCTFRVDNPNRDDITFLKKMVEIRINEIEHETN